MRIAKTWGGTFFFGNCWTVHFRENWLSLKTKFRPQENKPTKGYYISQGSVATRFSIAEKQKQRERERAALAICVRSRCCRSAEDISRSSQDLRDSPDQLVAAHERADQSASSTVTDWRVFTQTVRLLNDRTYVRPPFVHVVLAATACAPYLAPAHVTCNPRHRHYDVTRPPH